MTPVTRLRIAVLDDYQQVAAQCADWSQLDADVVFVDHAVGTGDQVSAALAGFDVIVAMRERTAFPAAVLEALPDLKLLVTTGMRNAAIDLGAAARLGVAVCGTRSPGHATAELTFGLILALARGLCAEAESVMSGGWQAGIGRDVRGATLGVIGLGRLGSQVAGLGDAFGMSVVAWSENLTAEAAHDSPARVVAKRELLESSDFVTVHVRLSDRTHSLIGTAQLASMQPSAYLVNTSRGEIVDEDALLDAVQRGVIAGAALDVYRSEPLPLDHPLRNEPRILTTPHIGYVTRETYEVFYGDAVAAIAAYVSGSPIRVLA